MRLYYAQTSLKIDWNIKELSVYAQPSKIMPTEDCVTALLNGVLYVLECLLSWLPGNMEVGWQQKELHAC